MKGIILYQSKYGATKKYADWLAEATGFTCVETKKAELAAVKSCDTIVLGGGIYASGIAGLSFLKKNYNQLKDRKIIVFCVGASPYDETAMQQIIQHNMRDEMRAIPVFYCRGAWDESVMGFADRALCKMLQKSVAKMDPANCEPWMTALMDAAGQKCDWTDRAYLSPILKELG